MKYYINLSIFALMLLTFSCKTAKEANDASTNVSESAVVEESISNEESIEPITPPSRPTYFASINRGACYGTCPIFEMFIYTNGTAILKGVRFIDQIGTFETILTEAEVQRFYDVAEEIDFFNLEDRYDVNISDLPSTTTMIRVNGMQKTVYRKGGEPKRLLKFEALFDELLTSKEWRNID